MPRSRLWVAAGLVWLDPELILLGRRSATAPHGPSALEFPGGKIEPGESPRAALRRELVEEWGPWTGGLPLGPVADLLHHLYPAPGPEVTLCLFHVDARGHADDWVKHLRCLPGANAESHARASLPIDAFLEADRDFARLLRAGEVRCPY